MSSTADRRKATLTIRLPEPHPAQEIFVDWEDRFPGTQVLVAPAGTKVGKALHVDTPIPTLRGWTTMGALKEGDFVFDEHGRPVEITYATDWMYNHACYEVVFSDGTSIVADAEHLWMTETLAERKNAARGLIAGPKIRTTEEILATLRATVAGRERPNHSVPLVSGPLQYPEAELPLDPYVLGAWLGDGTALSGSISLHDNDWEIRQEIERAGWEIRDVPSSPVTWRIVGLTARLRAMGVLGAKRIPGIYMTASPAQRIALLQGLMDTDGTASARGRCTFYNTDKDLADAVDALAVSLGIKVTRTEKIGRLNGRDHRRCYQVSFATDVPVFRLTRKAARMRPVAAKSRRRYIVDVLPVASAPVRCIRVDSPTHLFLAGEACVPTHNTLGASIWLLQQALVNPAFYCVWIAPTLYKCRIAYRYMKAMLPDCEWIHCKDGVLEIWFGNGSFIKFLHGRDAEVTVEGEAIDAFVVDEAGKQKAQLWYSLLTTITQTEGRGIVTGTPRGWGWYRDLYLKATAGDPMLAHATLKTTDSPFVSAAAVERARRILPAALFEQYYLALFVSSSGVYGDLSRVWDETLVVDRPNFWIHPDEATRGLAVCVGVDLAKRRDYTSFAAVTATGRTVGYVRIHGKPYKTQVAMLARFLRYFPGTDNELRYDRTGVGDAVGEEISAMIDRIAGDWRVSPVVFTNASKQEMVTRTTFAVEDGWWSCPKIPRVEHEFAALEVSSSKSGLHSYGAPDGDHDDVHWAFAMAISGAHAGNVSLSQLDMIEAALSGKLLTNDEDEPPRDDDAVDDDDFGDLADDDQPYAEDLQ